MLLLIAMAALAQTPPNPELVDLGEVRETLKLWSDGHGHYGATSGPGHIYYGDGKNLYDQTPYMYSQNGETFESGVRDPRYDKGVTLKYDGGDKLEIQCGKRATQLAMVKPDTAKSLIAKAVFKRRPHNVRAYSLARDDRGIYYYVDRGRYEDNEGSFRVFIGPRGAMSEVKLKNVVHDSAGDIFATPNGELRLITAGDGVASEWVQGDKRVKLLELPIEENAPMIYNDLGVYKRLKIGSPCDDL